MKLLVFFGLPGAGKTFAAHVAEKYFSYHIYDGDTDLTEEMRNAINTQSVISDDMRDVFFRQLIQSAKRLSQRYDRLIIHQTFIKEKYRKQFQSAIPQAKFILIKADTTLREKRLNARKHFPLDQEYARKMAQFFDKPSIRHAVINNNSTGEEALKEQLQKMLV